MTYGNAALRRGKGDRLFGNTFAGKRVLITGHTGFKGAWLSMILLRLGAQVIGYALPPNTQPSLFTLTGLANRLHHVEGDIRDQKALLALLHTHQPHFVFHLAAQPLVIESYAAPAETFDVNIMGTVALLEALRLWGQPCTAVLISSDKCYENRQWVYSYRETDVLGGHDPYSASKAAMELIIASYRASFFQNSGVQIASARAGNVIGGGDWARYRLVPDAIQSLEQGVPLSLRVPSAIRPWQHVLEPLLGYLLLATRLAQSGQAFASAWNFGPADVSVHTTAALATAIIDGWGEGSWLDASEPDAPHETAFLKLNIERACRELDWMPVWGFQAAVQKTVLWYRTLHQWDDSTPDAVYQLCQNDIAAYEHSARDQGFSWID